MFGFKKLFGTPASKPLLVDFLNAVLPKHHQIADLWFNNGEQLGQNEADRKAIYDIYCQSMMGERFIVELQRAKQAFFKERTVYYSTFALTEQAEKGGRWAYDLKAVYCVSILDFVLNDTAKHDGNVAHFIQLKDQNNDIFYDKLTYIYLEMPKFILQENQLTTQLDRWLFFIKNLKNLQVIPMMLQNNAVFEQAFKTAELAKMSRDEWMNYEQSLKTYRDNYATELYQRQQGREEGKQQGIKEGVLKTAKNLKNLGVSSVMIAEATGLSQSEIDEL